MTRTDKSNQITKRINELLNLNLSSVDMLALREQIETEIISLEGTIKHQCLNNAELDHDMYEGEKRHFVTQDSVLNGVITY